MAKTLDIPMGTGLGKSNALNRLKKRTEETVAEVTEKKNGNTTTQKDILYDDLVAYPLNRKNFFDIDLFAENIYRNGFIGYIIVQALHGEKEGKYMIISGHKRWKAIGYILSNIDSKFLNRHIPSIILPEGLSEDKIHELNILFNIDTDNLDPSDLRVASNDLMQLYAKDTNGKITKEIMQKTAERFNVKTRQLYKYRKINADLIPELTVMFDAQQITVDEAARFSTLPRDYQLTVYNTLTARFKESDTAKFSLDEFEVLRNKSEEEKQLTQKLETEIKRLNAEIESYKSLLQKQPDDQQYNMKIQELEEALAAANRRADKNDRITKEFKNNVIAAKKGSDQTTSELLENEVLRQEFSSKLAIIDRHTLALDKIIHKDYLLDKEQMSRIAAITSKLNQILAISKSRLK